MYSVVFDWMQNASMSMMIYQDGAKQPGPQGNTVYQRLLDEIREGALLSSDRLREIDLSERLGVSRTPVREAIRQLEADGLVTQCAETGRIGPKPELCRSDGAL